MGRILVVKLTADTAFKIKDLVWFGPHPEGNLDVLDNVEFLIYRIIDDGPRTVTRAQLYVEFDNDL